MHNVTMSLASMQKQSYDGCRKDTYVVEKTVRKYTPNLLGHPKARARKSTGTTDNGNWVKKSTTLHQLARIFFHDAENFFAQRVRDDEIYCMPSC